MLKLKKQSILISCLLLPLFFVYPAQAKTFKIADYNVENLFDLETSGNEYIEYVPNNIFGWDEKMFAIKVANIARVIKDINADIIGLEEIESGTALKALQQKLKQDSCDYPYSAIAKEKNTVVKCAVLSKYPITKTEEISINDSKTRNILKVYLDIDNIPLIVYVNHWKSKYGPEILRIKSAKALRKDIATLSNGTDFIVLGDFNSNYNEYRTIEKTKKLDHDQGITGINHILKTIKDSKMVSEQFLRAQKDNTYLYNLWLELPAEKRWSYYSHTHKDSPDSIILGHTLYDKIGISYIDDSFDRFIPPYLFSQGEIARWQRAKNGSGSHSGSGYSDHLPIFALFSTEPFVSLKRNPLIAKSDLKTKKPLNQNSLVDLNTAERKEFMAIKGIGKTLADKIIAARPYKTIDDLLQVKGIGKNKLESIRGYFTIKDKENQ